MNADFCVFVAVGNGFLAEKKIVFPIFDRVGASENYKHGIPVFSDKALGVGCFILDYFVIRSIA